MSPSIISFSTILLISSLMLITYPKHIDATTPSPLIRKACSKSKSNASINIDTELCLRLYPSIPLIASANDLFNLSLAIIETGVSYSTSTLDHVENVRPKSRAMGECLVMYGQMMQRFTRAACLVRIGLYVPATYQLEIASTYCVKGCEEAMALWKVEDKIVTRSGKVMAVFGFSAVTLIDQLDPPRPLVADLVKNKGVRVYTEDCV